MAEHDADNSSDMYSLIQELALAWVPRIASCCSMACALRLAYLAYSRRHGIYHRLNLGLSLHLTLVAAWQIAGTAAIPSYISANVWGNAYGTQASCTAQGFGIQLHGTSAIFYYACLSIYSYVAVRNSFNANAVLLRTVETLIHLGVHVFPVFSAVYLLHLQAYNGGPYTVCWIDSYPPKCGDRTTNGSIACERGPGNIQQIAGIFAGIPGFVAILTPTVVMMALYWHVKMGRRNRNNNRGGNAGGGRQQNSSSLRQSQKQEQLAVQLQLQQQLQQEETGHEIQSTIIDKDDNDKVVVRKIRLSARNVARQAGLYLCAIYWSFFLSFSHNALTWFGHDNMLVLNVIATTNVNLLGVWLFMIYRHFSVASLSPSANQEQEQLHEHTEATEDTTTGTAPQAAQQQVAAATTTTTGTDHQQQQEPRRKYSFNIFDGTNASGEYADFIFEGDSDDEQQDQVESNRWVAIQDYV